MKKIRVIWFLIIIFSGLFLLWKIPTISPDGKPMGESNSVLNKVIDIKDLDEERFGELIKERYRDAYTKDDLSIYINDVMDNLEKHKSAPFNYEVFIYNSLVPSIWAMPGGVIFITRGLVNELKSESELAAILASEMVYVEKGYSFEVAMGYLKNDNLKEKSIGSIVDLTFNYMMTHSYYLAMEAEAAKLTFSLIEKTAYDPFALLGVLLNLSNRKEKFKSISGVKEYSVNRPDWAYFISETLKRIKQWREENPQDKRYAGVKNLNKRNSYPGLNMESEWLSYDQ